MATDQSTLPIDIPGWFQQRLEKSALSVLLALLFLGIWQFGAPLLNTEEVTFVPTFTQTIAAVLTTYRAPMLGGMRITMAHFVVGFGMSVSLGVVLGIAFSEFYVVRQTLFPSLIFTYSIPHAILAPLFVVWFGQGLFGIGLFAAWTGFFPVFINTMTGMGQVQEEFQHLGTLFEANRWQMLKKIKFWSALPHISSGIKISVQQTIVGVIIAEFIATGSGLSWLIRRGQKFFEPELMWGSILVLIIFAFIIFNGVTWAITQLERG